jgi:hypothetical protein
MSDKFGVDKSCTKNRKTFQERRKERKKKNPRKSKPQTTCNTYKIEGSKN